MGLGSALVQQRDLREEDIRIANTRVILASLVMALSIYFLSGVAAAFFGDGQLAPVIRWMVPVFVLQALGIVPLALLRRDLDFRGVQISQLASYFTGYVIVGISCALLGAGVWSLVAAVTTTNLMIFIISYTRTRHSLAPLLTDTHTRLSGFGAKVALTNVSNWLIENIDNLLVGKLFGSGSLGLYSVSYNLVRTPTNHLVVALQSVIFPASARAQDSPEALRRGYLIVVSAVALIAFPLFAGVASVSDTVVHALFGNRWTDAADILVPLALAMTFHAIMAVAGPMLWGTGRPGAELKVQIWVALLLTAVLLTAAQISLEAVAWGVFAVYGLRAVWITATLFNGIRISPPELWNALRGGLLLAAAVLSILLGEDFLLRAAGESASYRLLIEILSATLTWAGLLLGAPNTILCPQLARVAQRLIGQMALSGHSPIFRRIQAAHRNAPA